MTLDDLKRDLSERIGQKVINLLTRDGETATTMTDLYQASPAGFGGRLVTRDGRCLMWDLWLEDEQNWNFKASPMDDD